MRVAFLFTITISLTPHILVPTIPASLPRPPIFHEFLINLIRNPPILLTHNMAGFGPTRECQNFTQ